ncbi:MAG: dioxygenase [Gemmatimonadaceae bacterium]|jgi:protocatechuate 3,4-dioxygenase beta subunit|nr:dioxygenase [Gemmatimonadaceae bacterium]
MTQHHASTPAAPAHADHDDHGGLARDLAATRHALDRRTALRLAARAGLGFTALSVLGCAADASTAVDETTPPTTNTTCTRIPEEAAGPFPGDGSNGANVLNLSGVVRSDIRSSFGGLSGIAAGIPMTLDLTIVAASTCAVLANHAVYLWHCDRGGNYSLYSPGVTNQNYLRGVQAADAAGRVRFTTIFPGCYAGRWPHLHFEVFRSITAAADFRNRIATSQIALPKATCDLAYATAGYEQSVTNLSRISLATDGIFRDGAALQLATMSGTAAAGYTATLTVAVAV